MRAFVSGLLLAVVACACEAAGAPQATRILFIGNSLSAATDIPGRLGKLAQDMGKAAAVQSLLEPAFDLEDHWKDARALAAIAKGWDVVVLQQGPSASPEDRAKLVEYARRFAVPIRSAGARPALFMTWPAQDRLAEFPATLASYRAAAVAADAILLPAGEAWLRLLSKLPRERLHSGSGHASVLGSDLAVLTIYLSLFPAGPHEFDEAYMDRIARSLGMEASRRDDYFDAATRAIDEPLPLRQSLP
jgi:hypothetical protein